MARDLTDYFQRRAVEEEKLAALSTHAAVKARHAELAETYRRRLAAEKDPGSSGGMQPA